ncbi:MAG: hypothetical protein KC684_03590 [Candidatus Omnitrophica bacterium]|nr:hypothetical protein [Candidatus Omnitrophota bacterium]
MKALKNILIIFGILVVGYFIVLFIFAVNYAKSNELEKNEISYNVVRASNRFSLNLRGNFKPLKGLETGGRDRAYYLLVSAEPEIVKELLDRLQQYEDGPLEGDYSDWEVDTPVKKNGLVSGSQNNPDWWLPERSEDFYIKNFRSFSAGLGVIFFVHKEKNWIYIHTWQS